MSISDQFKKAAIVIPNTNLILQEFLALVAEIKPVMYYNLGPNEIKLIRNNFPEINIACKEIVLNKKTYVCVLSKKQNLAQKIASSLYKKGYKTTLTGKSLGYPRCCVENFWNYINKKPPYDFSLITYNAYKVSKKCSPYANNLLNFSTRVNNIELDNFKHYESLNKKSLIQYWYYQYISHIPCRYDCPESIKIGKQISVLLKKYAPGVEKVVKYTLSKPILFFDTFKLIIFDGYLKGDVLYYKKIIPPFFPIDQSLLKIINEGNRITVDDNEVKILKNNSILFAYKKTRAADGFILDFSRK